MCTRATNTLISSFCSSCQCFRCVFLLICSESNAARIVHDWCVVFCVDAVLLRCLPPGGSPPVLLTALMMPGWKESCYFCCLFEEIFNGCIIYRCFIIILFYDGDLWQFWRRGGISILVRMCVSEQVAFYGLTNAEMSNLMLRQRKLPQSISLRQNPYK